MPLHSDQGRDPVADFRNYYAHLQDDEAKMRFLLMLKERRDVQRDANATVLLPELAERWISERWKSS